MVNIAEFLRINMLGLLVPLETGCIALRAFVAKWPYSSDWRHDICPNDTYQNVYLLLVM